MNYIPYGKQFIDKNDIDSVVHTLESDYLTTGNKIQKFENTILNYCDAKYVVAVSSGTAALHLSSIVLLNHGDKVLTTPNSFLATSNSILYTNAKPIFIDIQEDGNIDLDLCEQALKNDTTIKALYVVHFSGNPVNQEKLSYLRDIYKIKILEDCSHSLGAMDGYIKAGSCTNSDISVFSFHPVKHITTGEGGAITTNDKDIYKKLLSLRNHGTYKDDDMLPWEYKMEYLGFNYRLSDIHCALGISQFTKLPIFNQRRQAIARTYDKSFKDTIIKPLYTFDGKSSYHLYVVQVNFTKLTITKSDLFHILKEKGIGIQLHYMPINKQPYYINLGYGDEITPNMDKYYKECFSLPCYPSLTEEEQEYTITTLLEVLNA